MTKQSHVKRAREWRRGSNRRCLDLSAAFDGITVWPVSPLALYQLRAGIAAQASFGKLGEKQRRAMRDLKERFFSGLADGELMPHVEPLRRLS